LAAVVGMLLGTVGISIARQLFHETYDMSATTEAGQAFTLSKWQLFFYFLWGSGIMVCPARCAGIHLHWRSPVPLQWVQN
jgi:hypothetical protein